MTTRVHALKDEPFVLTPLRFTRAVSGRPRLDAPDLDDRGWEMPRPPGWVASEARGAMVGITVGDTVRLRVEREDFPEGAKLFVTASSNGPPQFKIAEPDGGGALPPDGVFRVEALDDNDTPQAIEIRLGSVTGPILSQAEPHVFSPISLRVVPHICTIHGPGGTGGTTPQVDLGTWFGEVRSILRPAGIRLKVGAPTHQVHSFAEADVPFSQLKPSYLPGELPALVGQGYVENRCNVYFVRYLKEALGLATSRAATCQWPEPAALVAVDGTHGGLPLDPAKRDQNTAWVMAHEICHFLGLSHIGEDRQPPFQDDYHWRNLMHPYVGASRNLGYGEGMNGALLTLKHFPNEKGDGQVAALRRHLRQPNSLRY